MTFGYSLQSPALHVVTNYQHHAVRLAYRKLLGLGYKRIGMLLDDGVDRRVDRYFSGGYHSMNPSGIDRKSIQPHVFKRFDESQFELWYENWRPDAVLVTGATVGDLRKWLNKRGMAAGVDLAFAEMKLSSIDGLTAGVTQQSRIIGRAAVNVLDSLLSQFEYEIPEHPLQTLIEGVWVDGLSAPARSQ